MDNATVGARERSSSARCLGNDRHRLSVEDRVRLLQTASFESVLCHQRLAGMARSIVSRPARSNSGKGCVVHDNGIDSGPQSCTRASRLTKPVRATVTSQSATDTATNTIERLLRRNHRAACEIDGEELARHKSIKAVGMCWLCARVRLSPRKPTPLLVLRGEAAGDATMIYDAVSIVQVTRTGRRAPSFEASGRPDELKATS